MASVLSKIWPNRRGIHPSDHKSESATTAVRTLPLPELLILPLIQGTLSLQPEVNVGDQVKKGQLIANSDAFIAVPLHAPTSGEIVAIEPREIVHPSGLFADCILLKPNGKEQWIDREGCDDFHTLPSKEIIRRIQQAGIRGMGGAGFPTSVKLKVPNAAVKTLIINGAECEPYISCDDRLMQERASDIVTGIRILQQLLEQPEVVIGIETNKPLAIASLQQAIESSELNNVRIAPLPEIYPMGGEKQLIAEITGQAVESGKIPLSLGVACLNVATTYAIAQAITQGTPLISRWVTITGYRIGNPGNYEALIGTPIEFLLKAADGYQPEQQKLLLGGPMMGVAIPSALAPTDKTSNCILALTNEPENTDQAHYPCIRCGSCANSCPMSLLPQQLFWHAQADNIEKTQEYNLFDCIECGCCDYVCPSKIPLTQYFRHAKSAAIEHKLELGKSEFSRDRHDAKQARVEKVKQEKEERMRKKKEALKKKTAAAGNDADNDKQALIAAALARAKQKKSDQE